MLEKLRPGELIVGRKTTLDIYTKSGRLLLSKGAMITNEQQIEILMKRGLAKHDPNDRVDYSSEFKPFRYSNNVNPFLEVTELEEQLDKAFRHIKSGSPAAPEAFYRDIRILCSQITGLAELAPEAMLGSIHWPRAEEGSYSLYHPVQCALLIAVVALRLKIHGEQLFCTLAAALTANLSLLQVQDRLNKQRIPLTDEQREILCKHPDRSVMILESMGVRDPMWIRAVLHHHERLDGSGYPQGLKDDAISNEAKLVALADIYIALIDKREYREALPVKVALRQIFTERGTLLGPGLTKLFLNQIGIYPPGTVVRLQNGDTAVVTERGENIQHPICAGIRAMSGQIYLHPPRRDTCKEAFQIVEQLPSDLLKNLQPFLFWGVHVRKAVEF